MRKPSAQMKKTNKVFIPCWVGILTLYLLLGKTDYLLSAGLGGLFLIVFNERCSWVP